MALTAVLSGCAGTPHATLPLSIDNGKGSQYGNYVAQVGGETQGPSGERCVIFNWDRPLTRDLAVRYTSEACPSKERPGAMICRDVARTIVPIADSNLRDDASGTSP